ncbi:P-loop containing nucleoside triphosphate hydrolase protein [Nemania abortiva]|nr:P-loop containing nucleoside triphosphate hydrolase protein [Nemania abortiva]
MEDAANTTEPCYPSRLAGRGQPVLSTNAIYTPGTSSIATEPSNITYPHRQLPQDNVEKFIGRTDVLEQMHIYLKPSNTQETQHYSIWGLGGVGKSQCALAYANLYQDDYDATFWVRAESEPSLNQSFISIATNLGLVSPSTGSSPSEARDMVLVWLRNSGCRWLMIFDNVETIDLALESMPTSPGSVLVTTRYPNVAGSARTPPQRVIQLKALEEEEAWSMFSNMLLGQHDLWKSESSLLDTEVTSARRLLEKLGGLPLGIRQMAALIRQKKKSVEDFLNWYQREAGNSKKIKGGKDFRVDPDYPYAVETVWALSFDALEKSQLEESSEAYILLAALSFLSPDSIPVQLFTQQCNVVGFCGDEDLITFEEPKEELVDLALIDMEGDNLSIHRLVQTTCLHHIHTEMLQKAFGLACSLLNAVFPKQLFGRPLVPEWPSCLLYATHVQNIATRFEELQSRLIITDEFLEVLSNCAWYLHEIGDWYDSGEMVRVAKLACPKEKPRVLSHLENTLGASLFESNKLEKCRESLDSALSIRRTIMEEGDEDLLCTINNYANLESGSGHPEKALQLYDEVQSIRERMGTETQVSLALTYGGKGQALVQLGRYVEAEEFYNKAYAIIVNEYGPEGHYVGHLHYVYGNLKLAKSDIGAALEDYRRGLEIYRASQPNHILTACLLFKIGCIDIKQGRVDDARRHLQEAKSISQLKRSEENVARIARKLWPLIKDDSDDTLAKESENLQVMTEIWERKLLASGSDMSNEASADKAFNEELCLFFR